MKRIEGLSADFQGSYFVMIDLDNKLAQTDIKLCFQNPKVNQIRNLARGFEGELTAHCLRHSESAYSNYEGFPFENMTVMVAAGENDYLVKIVQRGLVSLSSFKENVKTIMGMIQNYYVSFDGDAVSSLLGDKLKEAESRNCSFQ